MSSKKAAALSLVSAVLLALAPAAGHEGGHSASAQHAHRPKPKAARRAAQPAKQGGAAANRYACPMHPEVASASPGKCRECGMALKAAPKTEAKTEAATEANAPAAVETQPTGGKKSLAEASAGYFPNHVLVTQDNKPVRFYDDLLKGKVVLINFMFTTCTGVCPPMTGNMAKVRSYLGDRVGRDVVMISISVDPTVDTPDKLKKYADNFKAGPGWYFLTGEKQNVDWVLYKLGGYVDDKSKHSGTLIIGNEATGEWVKTAALRNPSQIAEAVLQLLKSDKH